MPSSLARWSRIPARWSRLARTTQLACGSLHTHTTATFWPDNLALNANPWKLSRMHGTPFRDADFSVKSGCWRYSLSYCCWLPQPSPHACSPSSPSRQASLSCRSRGRVGLEPHPPHTATTPTTAKAGLHSPRHDHLAGQSRVKTPPPRPLPRREVAVGMSYSLLWPPSEPTFSQTGSLGNVGGNRIPAMAHANRTTFGQAPECTTCLLRWD